MTLQDAAAIAGILAVVNIAGGLVVAWIRSSRRRRQLEHLARLREEGVVLRNAGLMNITTNAELLDWVSKREEWRCRVLTALRAVASHEATAFTTIGSTIDEDNVAGNFKVDGQALQVVWMTADLRRLEEIRRRYSITA